MKKLKVFSLVFIALFSLSLLNTNVYAGTNESAPGNGQGYNCSGGGCNYQTPLLWYNQKFDSPTNFKLHDMKNGGELNIEGAMAVSWISLNQTPGYSDTIPWYNGGSCSKASNFSGNYDAQNKWLQWPSLSAIGGLNPSTMKQGNVVNISNVNTYASMCSKKLNNLGYGSGKNAASALLYSYMIPDNLIKVAEEDGFRQVKDWSRGSLYKRGNKSLDAVWIQEVYKPKSTRNKRVKIVKAEDPNDSITPDSFDDTHHGDNPNSIAKWVYDYGKNSATYEYESPEGEKSYKHNLKYTIWEVEEIHTWKQNSEGATKDHEYKYRKVNSYTDSKIAEWQAKVPVLTTKLYEPYDLFSEDQIIKHPYNESFWNSNPSLKGNSTVSNDPLKINVNNRVDQDLNSSEKWLKLLDDNSGKYFDVTFNNNQHGIPTAAEGGIDINRSHTNYEYSKPYLNSGKFVKNAQGIYVAKQQYFNPKLYMASSNVDFNPQLTSLQFANEGELTGKSEYVKDWGFRGGVFQYRSIKNGTYYISSSKIDKYWTTEYQTSQHYLYGSKYKGTVSLSGSSLKWNSVTSGQPEGEKILITETHKWLDEASAVFKQPILRGTFRVYTAGGYQQ